VDNQIFLLFYWFQAYRSRWHDGCTLRHLSEARVCTEPIFPFEEMLERNPSRANLAAGRDGRGLNAQWPFALATKDGLPTKAATPTTIANYKSPRASVQAEQSGLAHHASVTKLPRNAKTIISIAKK
jgi:hypothetical protein